MWLLHASTGFSVRLRENLQREWCDSRGYPDEGVLQMYSSTGNTAASMTDALVEDRRATNHSALFPD